MALSHCILLGSAALMAGDNHLKANPMYRSLRQVGVVIHEDFHQPLPAPTMADGLDLQAQEEAIQRIAKRSYPLSRFVRKSVVAPHVLRINVVDSGHQDFPGRSVDLWFVAYGDLDTIADREFLNRLVNASREENQDEDQGISLTEADLAKRGILVDTENSKAESYGRAAYAVIKRVRLEVTGHSYWTRTSDSIIVASCVDPRFRDDEEFPNQWRSMSRNERGVQELGSASPYNGGGLYLKITELRSPEGALFVECHLVYSEPHAWFDGHNLLGAKLPVIAQSRVRSARRELMKAARP